MSFNVANEGNKISKSKSKVDNIIDELRAINNSLSNSFQGSGKIEIIDRINRLINECYDLEMEFVTLKNSLLNLSMDIADEAKKQEKLKAEKKNG